MMRAFKSEYYAKLLFQLFVAVLLPLCVIGGVMGAKMYSLFSETTLRTERLALDQVVRMAEEQLQGVRMSMLQFSSNQDTLRAMKSENLLEDFDVFSKLRINSLTLMQAYNSGLQIESVRVNGTRNGWVYDTALGYHGSASAEDNPQLSDRPAGWSVGKSYTKNQLFEMEENGHALIWQSRFLNSGEVSAQVNYEDFCAIFEEYSNFSDFYVLDSSMQILYDGNAGDVGTSARDRPFTAFLTPEQGNMTYRQEGQSYAGLYSYSPDLDWYFVLARKEPLSRRDFFGGMTVTILISFLVVAVALFFVSFLTRRLYRPISNLYRQLQPEQEEQAAGGGRLNEMQAIDSSVSRMLGDNLRLQRQVGEQRTRMRELTICQLFTGNLQGESDLEQLKAYGISLAGAHKALVSIFPAGTKRGQDSEPQSEVFFLSVTNLVRECAGDSALIAPILIHRMVVFLLGSDSLVFEAEAEAVARKIHDRVGETLGIGVQVAVSTQFDHLSGIVGALDRNRQLLSFLPAASEGVFPQRKAHGSINYPNQTSEVILESIKSGEKPHMMEALGIFLDDVFLRTDDIYRQQLYMVWLIGDILRLAPDCSDFIVSRSAKGSEDRRDLVQMLFGIESLEDKKQWLLEAVIRPVDEFLHTNDAGKLFIVKRMLSFIRENPCGASDIEACAETLRYNSSYLRKVFKDAMGVSYGQYVSRAALETACEMLETTALAVSAIAAELGYSNSQNFIRCFKKEFGITPGQYRSSKDNKVAAETR